MSKNIDERVVEMRFDNSQFEKNVSQSMSTLDKLKQSLNFKGATKGLENLNSSARKVDMSGVSKGIETVHAKFSALEVMGVTALANITNSAVNAGKRIVKAFTIDPISTGFSEYELKMGSIQTIMASTGESLETVNRYLEELNAYSDKTIYSFSDMTQNIGKFTNAGVDLDSAVLAIKGVSNAAALSGANANEASRAMYNFAQALSAGYVKLIDWKSIENANMATVAFKEELIASAVAAGTLTKTTDGMYKTLDGNIITATKNFNESLQDQWMTTEVLISTLKNYADANTEIGKKAYSAAQDVKTFSMMMDTLKESAQSGWATTWEIIIGDYEEAKSVFTKLTNFFGGIIDKANDARNSMLRGFFDSKWEQLSKEVSGAGIEISKFKEDLIATAKTHNSSMDDIIAKEEKFEDTLKHGWLTSDIVVETLKNYTKNMDGVSESTEDMTAKLEYFQKVVNRVWNGDYDNGEARIKKLTEAGYNYAEVQALVNKTVNGHKLTLEDLNETQMKSLGYTEEQIKAIKKLAEQAEATNTPLNKLINNLTKKSGRELIFESWTNIVEKFTPVLNAIREAWDAMVPKVDGSQILYNIAEAIHTWTENLDIKAEDIDCFTRAMKGFFAAIPVLNTFTINIFKTLAKVISGLFGLTARDILKFAANVGDAILKFKNALFNSNLLSNGLEKLGTAIVDAAAAVKEWLTQVVKLPDIQKHIKNFNTALNETVDNITAYFANCAKAITDFLGRAKSMNALSLSGIIAIVKDFGKNVLGTFLDVNGMFTGMGTAISSFVEDMKNFFGGAIEGATTFKEKLFKLFESIRERFNKYIGLGEILTIGIGFFIVKTMKTIGNALDKLGNIAEGLVSLPKNLGAMFKSIGEAKVIEAKSKAMINFAIAIAILAASLALMTRLDMVKLGISAGILIILGAALVGFVYAINKMSGSLNSLSEKFNAAKFAVTMLSISTALLMLIGALKLMDTLNAETLKRNVSILGALALGLSLVAIAMSQMAPQLTKGSFFMITFAASLFILVASLSKLNDVNLTNIQDKLITLVAIMGSLALIATLTKGTTFGGSIGTVVLISVGLLALVKVINKIAELDITKITDNITAFITIFGMFAVLMAASSLTGKYAAQGGAAIIAMSLALMLMVSTFKTLANVNQEDLIKATDVITKMLVAFGVVVALSNFAGKYAVRAGAMLMMMSAAMIILAGVIVVLAHIGRTNPEGLTRAIAAVTALEVVFGILIAVTALAPDAKKLGKTLTTLAVTIGILAIALGALSFMKKENLMTATGALVTVIGTFALLVASTNLAKKCTGTLVLMIALVASIGHIIRVIGENNPEGALAAAHGISTLLIAMSTSVAILGTMKTATGGALLSALALVAIAALLGVLVNSLTEHCTNVDSAVKMAIGLSVLLLALSESVHILSIAGINAGYALAGIVVLVALVAALGGLLAAFSHISNDVEDLEGFLSKGVTVFGMIGTAVGALVGGIIGGVAAGATLGLPLIGKNLSMFMDAVKPFLDGIGNVNPNSLTAAKTLAETILILTAADVISGLTSWFGGSASISNFGKELVEFGVLFKTYANTMSGISDMDVVTKSATAAKSLAEFASIVPNSGGLLASLVGDNTLSNFARGLVPFGVSFAQFAKSIEGVDADVVTNVSAAAQSVAEFARMVPNTGGILSSIVGDNTLYNFGLQLSLFGPKFAQFATSISGIKNDVVTAVTTTATSVAEFAKVIPNSGGLLGLITGDNTLYNFGVQVSLFGPLFAKFATSIADVNTGVIDSTIAVVKSISTIATDLPNTGGLAALFTGDNDLITFGEHLVKFGKSFAKYSKTISGIDAGVVTTTTAAARTLVSLQNGLPDSGGWFSDKTSLTDFGKDLANFGYYFKVFYNNVKNTGTIDKALYEIKLYRGEFYKAGQYLVDGFAQGISANTYKATAKAKAMAKAAADAAKKELDEHSPSKVFYGIGEFAGMGFVNALGDYAINAADAGANIANSAVKGLKNTIARISEVIDGDIDVQPTIRPVLDMSNIKEGANSLNGLFASRQTVALAGNTGIMSKNINAISSGMSINQNGSNDDVISAIKDLKNTMSNISGDTYNLGSISYDDGSRVQDAVRTLVNAAKVERRK